MPNIRSVNVHLVSSFVFVWLVFVGGLFFCLFVVFFLGGGKGGWPLQIMLQTINAFVSVSWIPKSSIAGLKYIYICICFY